MAVDIFEFWAQIGLTDRVHPADRAPMSRVNHGFDLDCLPAAFAGPLRTAPVVLLYLSFGFDPTDRDEAKSRSGQERYARMRAGNEPLVGPEALLAGYRWSSARTRAFGEWEETRRKIAILNIGAYHSKTFEDRHLLAALPSSRVSLDWAQSVLFPEAEAGKRVVICMRAAKFWGLEHGRRYGRCLFAPEVTRSGHMLSADPMRAEAIKKAKALMALQA